MGTTQVIMIEIFPHKIPFDNKNLSITTNQDARN